MQTHKPFLDTTDNLMTLPRVVLHALLRPFLSAIMPRLFLIVFRYSQPLLLKESIRFVISPIARDADSQGFTIVCAAIAVYSGLAVS
jgi:ATP-binding cassette subfamily C (CFTR/MRP) protein 1